MPERKKFNQKRRIMDPSPGQIILHDLAAGVRYVGSPYHKRNPGDFNLTPPAQPRPDKTLCDSAGIYQAAVAQHWLEDGACRGLVSDVSHDAYPKYIWAVTEERVVLEATSSGGRPGEYHGYPLFEPDPFRQVVLERLDRQ
jgi:hypothetical protein